MAGRIRAYRDAEITFVDASGETITVNGDSDLDMLEPSPARHLWPRYSAGLAPMHPALATGIPSRQLGDMAASMSFAGERTQVVYYDEPPPETVYQPHPLGTVVCALGHRYPMRVVAVHEGPGTVPVLTAQDERNPNVQPFPVVRLQYGVHRYSWGALLLVLSATPPGREYCWTLTLRSDYLDACAHLHDLATALPPGSAQDNARAAADELLNEAAIVWWEGCGVCEGRGTLEGEVTDEMRVQRDASRVSISLRPPEPGPTVSNMKWTANPDGASQQWTADCDTCTGTGRVSRITDAHRLRLVEALIAAGLEEASPSTEPEAPAQPPS